MIFPLFLCFTTYFCIFSPKNLVMSKICCTFAPEIEKDMLNHLLLEADGATLGSDFEGIRQQKTIAAVAARIEEDFFDFGSSSILFLVQNARHSLAIV